MIGRTRWRCHEARLGDDPYRRDYPACGTYEEYQHEDESWICERCGHVELPAAKRAKRRQPARS